MKRGDATDRPKRPAPHESREFDVLRQQHIESSHTVGDASSRDWEIPAMYPQGTLSSFEELRTTIPKIAKDEFNSRMERNAKLSLEEWKMGITMEDLEPQVRGAVLELNRKGYTTEISGLYKDNVNLIQINSHIDGDTKQKLENIGVKVEEGTFDNKPFTEIVFKGIEPNLYTLQHQWREIAALFPKKGEMETNMSSMAQLTRSLDGKVQRMDTPEPI
jgi:hypothetical protein